MLVAIDNSEFRYLPAQAEALGVPVPRVERQELTLPDGRTLSALRFGDDPPRVTLLHGAGLNAHTWDTTALALGLPLLAIDLAGHGDSSWRDDADYTAHPLAADVAIALETRDELVDKAIALGFGGSRPDTERGVFLNTRVRPDGRIEWKHHFAHLAAAALAAHDSEAAASPALLRETGWDDLAGIRSPLTLVRATRGFVSEQDADELQHRVPAARIVTVDATHNVQETAPQELAALIAAAL